MRASIIIPSFNTAELLRKNLPAVIKAAANPKNEIKEVIVVDDASTDNSADIIKREFPGIKLIRHKANRGFSAAVNTGVRMAKGELVVLLNSDVIPDADFLSPALVHFEDTAIFAVSFNEREYFWAGASFEDGFVNHKPGPVSDSAHISFWASGGSAVFRRKYWIALGGMDEKLFSPFYREDVDLCYRAQKRGMKVLWEPKAIVVHQHASTISRLPKKYTQRIKERNELLFIWKNITSPYMFRKHISGLLFRTLRHPGYLRIVLMALAKIKIVVRARRKEKKEAKISDETIFGRFK